MSYKSRDFYPVIVDICKKCKKIRKFCCCKQTDEWDEVKEVLDFAVKERKKETG